MTLQQALDMADKASPDIQSARLATLESQAAALSVQSARRPQVTFGVATTVQTSNLQAIGLIGPGIPSRVGPYRTFDARPSVTWRVLDLSLLASVRAAQARTRQNEAEAAAVSERTRAAVIDLYLQTLEAGSQARANEARITTAEAVLHQTNLAEEAGRSSKLDIARATQQLEKERAGLVDLNRQRDVLSTMLQKTIGLEARAPVALAELPAHAFSWDFPRDAIVREALDARPERRSIAAKENVISSEIEQAEKQRYPKLDVLTNYGLSGQGPDHSLGTWEVAASLTVPIWTSGRIENDIKVAQYRRDQSKQEDRQLSLAIEQEVTQSILEGKAAADQFQHLSAAADAAREALELARLRYESGLATNLDVVTAQGELAQSEEELIRARYNGLLAEARVARARGNVRLFADAR
jgi:outer membrane protein TolC